MNRERYSYFIRDGIYDEECHNFLTNYDVRDRLNALNKEVIELRKLVPPKDFGTEWNKRMDELGAEKGTIKDLLAI